MTDPCHLHLWEHDITHHLIHGMIHGFTESAFVMLCGRPQKAPGVNIRFWLKRMHALTCISHLLLQERDSHLPVSYGSFWRTFHIISPRTGLPTTMCQFPTYLPLSHRHLGGDCRFISSYIDLNLTTGQPDNLTASTLRCSWAKGHTTRDKANPSERDTSLRIKTCKSRESEQESALQEIMKRLKRCHESIYEQKTGYEWEVAPK